MHLLKPKNLGCIILLAGAALPAQALELPSAGTGSYRVGAGSLKDIRFRATLRQRFDFSCGSAAVATLLTHHYDMPMTEQQVFTQMYLHGDQQKIRSEGFSLLDMQRFLGTIGLRADGFQLPLKKLVEAGWPAIVLVSDKGYHHFIVIKGYANGRVLLGDPASGTRSLPLAAFETIWRSKLLFVIHNFKGRPVFNRRADWRAAPAAPLADVLELATPTIPTLPKLGPGDF